MPALRVLVVDDSAFMRTAVARVLGSDGRFEVVGQGKDGLEAVKLARELEPDVITMDFNMPGQNGAEATRAILAERATPIVMLSAHTKEGATATLDALAAGAIDFVAKPDGEVSASLASVKEELVTKLLAAAGANVRSLVRAPELSSSTDAAPVSRRASRGPSKPMPPGLRVVVIASSTGGPAALMRVVPKLAVGPQVAVLIVQHMPEGFTAALATQLAALASFPVREARADEELVGGVALVAPGGRHLIVERTGRLTLADSPPVHGVKPAADVTLKSAAQVFGARVVGVVLTGMGRDGALGLAAVKAAGGRTVAQDKQSSTVYGMPKVAVEMGVVDDVANVEFIGSVIGRIVG